MALGSNIGIMEGAFFVGKTELLNWVNDLLQLNITRVEQMATGAAYCQIIDAVFPGSIKLSKVNWQAKYDHEYAQNFKLLQQAFEKNRVDKYIEVEKLIKARSLDNLEFLQWFKRFVDLNFRGGDYPAVERRHGAKTPWDIEGSAPHGEVKRAHASPPARAAVSPPTRTPKNNENALKKVVPKKQSKEGHENEAKQIEELKSQNESMEKERDFYYGKLRAVELLCDHYDGQENPTIHEVQKILFATDEETVAVNDDGTVSVTPIRHD
ncbi:unnamed protein product [Blepharisma stoltei]|uniref:Microtubule-associated protein RP/EB family member 1 n=1 Tax=Blepharisma stoltei TaxID=1481888 RepID=A0AAU9JR90_9CILI|nr:unnamed protein product [Blepharisma stoltei]